MADLVLAEKDPAVVLSEALAAYKATTGVTLQPADPRRLHLQALLLLLAQQRALIDFSGKQSLLRYVSALWINELAALQGEAPLPAKPSTTTLKFTGTTAVPTGTRATDGVHLWATTAPAEVSGSFTYAPAACTVDGAATNGVAINQIDTLVDVPPGIGGVTNTTQTAGGRDLETTEAFRERLRSIPESASTCGPRSAYEALALAASASVADAVALGPDDSGDMAGTPPGAGHVFVLIIEGTRDDAGHVATVIPTPSGGLVTTVGGAITGEKVRPLGDSVTVKAPRFVDYNVDATYYIPRSRSAFAVEIQAAVNAAHVAYKLAQCQIGRDINPDDLRSRCIVAGAKRLSLSEPAYTVLHVDECAFLVYDTLAYGGIEDD